MKLKDLLACLSFIKTEETIEHIHIEQIEVDSRLIEPNDLFVCIRGYTVDGHDYVEQAIANGAVAIIAEEEIDCSVPVFILKDASRALAVLSNTFYDAPTKAFDLIGVTGTNGKTTITYILEQIFKEVDKKTGLIGTIQMKIGDESYPIKNTTPDSLVLQRSYRKMADEDVEIALMEVSSHALDLGRAHGCDFNVAVFTNLSQDHLDYHGNMSDYLRAKSLLFSQLGNVYNAENPKYAILNKDDDSFAFLKKSTAQQVISYGLGLDADVYATDIILGMEKTAFTLNTPIGKIEIDSHLIGKFNVYNMLAASAVAITRGLSLTAIQNALSIISGVDGRFESIRLGQSYSVIIDFAHTEDSLRNVLETVEDFIQRNIYVVVGCGGERDKKKRPLMAEVATKLATEAFFTSDNPRNEDPLEILNDMTAELERENFTVIENRAEAIDAAINKASPGDLVLIAGKGHETSQIIGTIEYEFDDREVAKRAIEKKES